MPENKPSYRRREGSDRGRKFNRPARKPAHKDNAPRRVGFSEFQIRLVQSILKDVLSDGHSLDKAYAYFFSKVKLPAVEQGFLLRQINTMFRNLSLYAYACGLKRPSDLQRHPDYLLAVYCLDQKWPIPELAGSTGLDLRRAPQRLEEGKEDGLLGCGCPIWLEELGFAELGEAWPAERQALGQEAKRFIRTNTLKGTREELAHILSEDGIVTRPVAGAPLALEVTSSAALFRTKAFKEGRFEQQDAGSQQIAAFVEAEPGMRVIDACAGQGGKTLQLAADMKGKGVLIALDTEAWKLDEMRKRARRAGAFNIEPRPILSHKVIKRLHGSADRVLIDAPCSGIGVLRRMPDSKWRDLRPRLKDLTAIQADLLDRYTLMAKPGGIIVYSTCSILPTENRKQIDAFLAKHGEQFELIEDKTILPSQGTDGFYMAKLKRLN